MVRRAQFYGYCSLFSKFGGICVVGHYWLATQVRALHTDTACDISSSHFLSAASVSHFPRSKFALRASPLPTVDSTIETPRDRPAPLASFAVTGGCRSFIRMRELIHASIPGCVVRPPLQRNAPTPGPKPTAGVM